MENPIESSTSELSSQRFCQKVANHFSTSSDRAGKPGVKWDQVHGWLQNRQQDDSSHGFCKPDSFNTEAFFPTESTNTDNKPMIKAAESSVDISQLEFEARSSKDGAWYDVDSFVAHRFLSSGEPEVRVRFVGFGAEEDEWINVKAAVRERSLPLENFECHKVKVGDLVLCFQERREQAIYYDAHVVDIQRRLHDVRGCRCLFLVRYENDGSEERVQLRRLCCRPTFQRRYLATAPAS